jgi:ubiquitin conjugation factor E4 B
MSRRENNEATDSLVPYLLHEPEEERGICLDFMAEAVARFDEDSSAQDMLMKAFKKISEQLSKMTMNDHFKPYIHVCHVADVCSKR